jgi:selenophosphate synthetase-related protein
MKSENHHKTKLPVISLVLMAIFLIGGSIMLLIKWPPGPANLDWGVWILAYLGYIYLIAASIFYVKTDR